VEFFRINKLYERFTPTNRLFQIDTSGIIIVNFEKYNTEIVVYVRNSIIRTNMNVSKIIIQSCVGVLTF
jgi:hypothetical protein